ncbi:hypothetical protein Leryth_018087 [Lithospermum erythrorhizon]|nr:hypothetical protein Leryth_018087 [Lithospermum erythrorhizon]
MVGEDNKEKSPVENMKTCPKSASWTEKPPTMSSSRTKFKSKARAAFPSLQPLSVNKACYGIWPFPGSDDLGLWLNSPLPAAGGSLSFEPAPSEGVRLTRDRLAFFNKACSKIIDYIFLGSDTVARNRDVLLQNGITHVLNCVGFVCPEYFKDDFVYKTLWLHDNPCEDITSILYDVFDYFEDVRENGGTVFVHCCQGVSRSTSLVIAYLMWKEEQSFEDAFQLVKAARGVTNPNMGFACQLLECQKSLHALPATPNSVLKMYRMAPHCTYDPLHLVPKRLTEPSRKGLDSRGAFIVHIPSAIYVWVGDQCISMMVEKAKAAAVQIIHYEKAQGPAMIIKEGEEPFVFWEALGIGMEDAVNLARGRRLVQSYDLDFEVFHKAVSGGVVPPFSLSGDETVTCLPAREIGWRWRRKFVSGIIKEVITSPVEPSSTPYLPNTISSDAFSRPYWLKNRELKPSRSLGSIVSSGPSYSALESFGKPASGYASPSLSPSNSGSSSPFTFSPSSSNWSDLSTQQSPVGLESQDSYHYKIESLDDPAILLFNEKVFPSEETSSAVGSVKMLGTFPPWKGSAPSLTDGSGNIPAPETMLPSVPSASQDLPNLSRSGSFSLVDPEDEIMKDVDSPKQEEGYSADMKKDGSISDTDIGDDNKKEITLTTSSELADSYGDDANFIHQ